MAVHSAVNDFVLRAAAAVVCNSKLLINHNSMQLYRCYKQDLLTLQLGFTIICTFNIRPQRPKVFQIMLIILIFNLYLRGKLSAKIFLE